MIIAVTGCVGTGKTTLATQLAQELGYTYVDVNKVIEEHQLSEGYDKERDCVIVDPEKVVGVLGTLGDNIVIDSHLAHYAKADKCIVTTCELKVIKTRLEKRGYSEDKIKQNLEAAAFDVCHQEAIERGHTPIVIDTTNGFSMPDLLTKL